MGFLKKLKETAEKSIEKGVELGTKGYDTAMDAAKKGIENARPDTNDSMPQSNAHTINQKNNPPEETKSKNTDSEEIVILKQRLAKGEITKEEFEEMKEMLE